MKNAIQFTRVNNDINGNPRYVCHYTNLLTSEEMKQIKEDCRNNPNLGFFIDVEYNTALYKAKKIGGRKFHNKQYGGGIVFQSYNIQDLERKILDLIK